MSGLSFHDIAGAARRIAARVRQVPVIAGDREGLWLALEYVQHTGSFKARGAQNFLAADQEAGRCHRRA